MESLLGNGATDRIQRTKRAAVAHRFRLWDSGIIPYYIDENAGYDFIQKARFRAVMDDWESETCIKFVDRNANAHMNSIRFTVSIECGCCSFVGRIYHGQDVVINEGCHSKGTILHELGHVIGFNHEHSRPDRDEFVEIQSENIISGEQDQFSKKSTFFDEINSLGESYDFDYRVIDYINWGNCI